jgi:hypothetical protein
MLTYVCKMSACGFLSLFLLQFCSQSITVGEQGRDRSSDLHPTLCSCFFPFFLTRLHSLSPNVMPVGGFPHRDHDQVAQADWASRRLQSVIVAEGSNSHLRMSIVEYLSIGSLRKKSTMVA